MNLTWGKPLAGSCNKINSFCNQHNFNYESNLGMICDKIKVRDSYLDCVLEFYFKASVQSVEWKLLRCFVGLKGMLVSVVEILIHFMNGSLSSVPILNGVELESKHTTDSSMLYS